MKNLLGDIFIADEREGQQENICTSVTQALVYYNPPVLYSPTSLSTYYMGNYIILFSMKTKYVKGVPVWLKKKKHQPKKKISNSSC
jgi:hypothetical protein